MKVSICIPTYNQTRYLEKVLNSILNQTYKDYEIIVSDDSTNNDVRNLIEEYSKKTDAIKYYRNGKPLGTPANWNNAIGKALGEFIKIMHHDDWFCETDALQKMVDLAVSNPEDVVFCSIKGYIVKEDRYYYNRPDEYDVKAIHNDPYSLLKANIIGPPSTIIYKRNNLYFDEELKWFVDVDFYIKLLLCKTKFIHIKEYLVENVHDDHNVTNECVGNKKMIYQELNHIILGSKLGIKNKVKIVIKNILINKIGILQKW